MISWICGIFAFKCVLATFSVYRPKAYVKRVYYFEITVQRSFVQFSS